MAARTKPKRLQRLLRSSADVQKPGNLIRFFEQVKGRKATAQEVAQLERKSPAAKDREPQ